MKKKSLIQNMLNSFPKFTYDEAYGFILCGEVFIDGQLEKNPKTLVNGDSLIEIRKKSEIGSYVSRGGKKLQYAVHKMKLQPCIQGKVFLDAGASSGGFTHCLLEYGALLVHTVDVGYNQLDYLLRKDCRVIVHERKNITDVDSLYPTPHAAVVDISFRSLKGIASHILHLTTEGWMVALIKPQFETDHFDGFDGVIREPERVVVSVISLVEKLSYDNVYVHDLILSPIKGRKGNIELLAYIKNYQGLTDTDIKRKLSSLISG